MRAVVSLIIILALMTCCATESAPTLPLIRLHILANSNSERDQMIKYCVRDSIIERMNGEFGEAKSLGESREILLKNLEQLEREAQSVLKEHGSSEEVKAYYGMFDFPTKYYGSIVLPAGRYEAIKLVLGEGKGANWWCVLFPPLCFVEGKSCTEGSALTKPAKLKPALAAAKIWHKVKAKIADSTLTKH